MMGPKTRKVLDELYVEYREARANGEMGVAVRLLTRINQIEAAAEERSDSESGDT